MKNLKLSKTSWLILSAGVFIVVLVGLGLTRSQQIQEQTGLDEELSVTQKRLDNLQITELQEQQEQLQQRVDEREEELDEIKDRLRQPIASVDVTDEVFQIAEYSNVTIMSLSTTPISGGKLGGVSMSTISVVMSVTGHSSDVINFVINLNHGLTTGVVQMATISIPEDEVEELSSASLNIIVYSYKGT